MLKYVNKIPENLFYILLCIFLTPNIILHNRAPMQIYTLLGILLLLIGFPVFLIGYKIINPFRRETNPEKEFIFYRYCGLVLRLSGPLLLIISIYFILNLGW